MINYDGSGLSRMFVNAQSILNNLKLNELAEYALDMNLHVIGIAESWLNDSIDNTEICLRDYTVYRNDRSFVKSGKGGGVYYYYVFIIILDHHWYQN